MSCEPPFGTLTEVDATWNFDDVMRANAILDFKIHSQKLQQENAK